jgi:hypothetical protein
VTAFQAEVQSTVNNLIMIYNIPPRQRLVTQLKMHEKWAYVQFPQLYAIVFSNIIVHMGISWTILVETWTAAEMKSIFIDFHVKHYQMGFHIYICQTLKINFGNILITSVWFRN